MMPSWLSGRRKSICVPCRRASFAVSAFNVTHDRSLEENPPEPAPGNLRETPLYQEALQFEPALVRQSDETLQALLSAAAEIPDPEERRRFLLASSHAGMLRLYQDGDTGKNAAVPENGERPAHLGLHAHRADVRPGDGDVLAYFYTSDINDAMIYRRITAGIIDKNFDNVSYLDPETQILYRTENTENGQVFTPQPYQEAVEFALTNFVRSEEAKTSGGSTILPM
jgi:hypothetical protein